MSNEFMKYEIENNEYVFVNEYWSTSRAWGHKTRLFKNGSEIAENKVRYYNRTWERYTYQSCMLGAIDNVVNDIIDYTLENYKYEHNITRWKKGEKEKVIADFEEQNPYYKQLAKLREKVS